MPTTPSRFPQLLALDLEDFQASIPPSVLRKGIDWYRDHRITDLTEEDGLLATFDGGRRNEAGGVVRVWPVKDEEACPSDSLPIGVEVVSMDNHAGAEASGDYGFQNRPWEQGDEWGYALAAVLAYQALQPVDEALVHNAADRSRLERVQRSREEVATEPERPESWFGIWRAHSVGVVRPGQDRYRVQIRALRYRLNSCTCPDFQLNGLGTCKHIEAVLKRLRTAPAGPPERVPATVFRLFADDGTFRWGVQLPRAHRDELLSDLQDFRAMTEPLADEALPPSSLADGALELQEPDQERYLFRDLSTPQLHELMEQLVGHPGFQLGPAELLEADEQLRRQREALRCRRVEADLAEPCEIPGFTAEPFPYQWEGIRFLAARGRALLADDMGLGKTIQSIAAIRWMMEQGEVSRTLIVCPTSLMGQWKKEIERFSDLEVHLLHGNQKQRRRILRSRPQVAITTYDRARLDFDLVQNDYAPDLLVLDEAQKIKNWKTLSAKYLTALRTRFAFVLTGTPLENKLSELHSLMQVVDPRILGPLWRFELEFCLVDLSGNILGYRNLSGLRERLRPVLLRRDRGAVLHDLPDRTDTVIDVPMDRHQKVVHDDALGAAQRLAAIARRRPLGPAESNRLMASLQKARMACDAGYVVDDNLPPTSPKLEELRELLEELCITQKRKVVVFSEWLRMAELAENICSGLGLRFVRLHGQIPGKTRSRLIDAFETDPSVRVFISSDTGGLGLNLQAGSGLIHLDTPWNPAILNQRTARIHRHGQTEKVQVFHLRAEESYEQHVAALVDTKEALFGAVVDPNADVDTLGASGRKLEALLEALETGMGGSDAPPPQAHPMVAADDTPGTTATDDFDPDALRKAVAQLDIEGVDEREALSHLHELLDTVMPDCARLLGRSIVVLWGEPFDEEDLADGTFDPLPITLIDGSDWETALATGRLITGREPVDPTTPQARDWIRAYLDLPEVEEEEEEEEEEDAPVQPDRPDKTATSQPRPPASSTGASQRLSSKDPRLDAALVLYEQGQLPMALKLLANAELDQAAGALGVRAPDIDDAWRWLYTEALAKGAVDADRAAALAFALGTLSTAAEDEEVLERAWLALRAA